MKLLDILVFCTFSVSTPSVAASQSTIFWYRFNGTPGDAVGKVRDSGPLHFTGVTTGALNYSANVTSGGGAASLDATADYDYVTITDAPALRPAGAFTLSAFAEPMGGTSGADGDYIVVKKIGVENGNCLSSYALAYSASSQHFFGFLCDSSNPEDAGTFVTSKDQYPPGIWHKLQLKYVVSPTAVATIKLFIDGVLEGSVTKKKYPGIYYGSGPLLIGAANFSSGDHDEYRRNFNGFIDEVKLTIPASQ